MLNFVDNCNIMALLSFQIGAYMKKWFVLLLIALVLVLAACANTSISYQLTEDNRVDVDYRMEITPGEEDISTYTDKISDYWESMGFAAETAEADGTTTLTGTKSIPGKDTNEAVQTFSDIFTDEESLFYDAEFTYTPSYFQDDFSLKANISLEDVLRQNKNGGLPAAAAQSLMDKAAECEYTLSIALPGEVVSTNADSQDGQVFTWNLKYGETTQIELSTSNVFSSNVEYYGMLQNALSRDNLLVIILGVVAGLALIAAVLIFVLRVRKGRTARTALDAAPIDQNVPPADQQF